MALSELWRTHAPHETPFLYGARIKAGEHKNLRGMRILNNTPLSPETMMKVDCLVQAGADVVVTETEFIKPHTAHIARKWLHELKIPYIPEHKDLQPFYRDFDFVLDCSAELFGKIEPKMGFVELTGGGTPVFKKNAEHMQVPVISIDDSQIKSLETFFGTSDGFLRALHQFYPHGLVDLKVVIIGYGKVGHGVAYRLRQPSSPFKLAHLTALDICPLALSSAKELVDTCLDAKNINEARKVVMDSDMIITAAGMPGVVSSMFKREELQGKILINLSADDDFGANFLASDVLGNKQPLNFLINDSTHIRYLDPSLYAHNLAIELILERGLKPGYHPLPPDVDQAMLKQWQSYHSEDISLLKRFAKHKSAA